MSGFAVVLELSGQPVGRTTIERLRGFLEDRSPDDHELRHLGRVAFARWGRGATMAAASYPRNTGDGDAGNSIHVALAGQIYRDNLPGEGGAGGWLARRFALLGVDSLRAVNGQFSAVFWDERAGELCGVRDQLGVAQLYYYQDDARLVCATEIQAILALPEVRRACDSHALADYIFNGAPLGGRTFFSGIRRLGPGHAITYRDGSVQMAPYWEVDFGYRSGKPDHVAAAELAELLEDAVRLRVQGADVVGGQLSGGIDSSVVLGLAARQGVPTRAYSISFEEGGVFDERRYSDLAAERFGIPLRRTTPRPSELLHYWPALIAEHECPLANAGAYSYFAATRLAAKEVDTSLAGHGGDEVFGGYRAQFEVGFGRAPWFAGTATIPVPTTPLSTRVSRVMRRSGVRGVLRSIANRSRHGATTPEDRWIQLHCSQTAASDPMISRDFVRSLGGYSPRDDYLADFVNAPTDHPFDRCLYHDLRTYLPVLMHQGDTVARALGVEVHSPLLDLRVVEYATRIAPEQRVRGLVPKYLLRQAASWLPREILDRHDKLGFPVPTNQWLVGELSPWVRSVLHDPQTLDRGILDPDEIRRDSLSTDALWKAINIELWFRIFIDQDREWCERARSIRTETRQRLTREPVPSLQERRH